MSWQENGACARPGVDRSLRTKMTTPHPPDAAKLLCAACPVALECVKWAATEDEFEGLAGGAVFTAKTVHATGWTPNVVLAFLPSIRRRAVSTEGSLPGGPPGARTAAGRYKPVVDVEAVEDFVLLGVGADEAATRLGVKRDSLYMSLHRAGRTDLWVALRDASSRVA